jgi:Flp pilus assembly protein TadB
MGDKKQRKDSQILSTRPYRRIGSVIPKIIIGHFEKKLRFAGIRTDARTWVGKELLLALCFGMMVMLAYSIIYNSITNYELLTTAIGLGIVGFVLMLIAVYMKLYFEISDRASFMERILSDFLLLTSSNLRAGMTPYLAFIRAAKPEFGAFYEEVRLSMAKSGGAVSLVESLEEISKYFDSQMLKRTTTIFGKGIRSGGQLAKLLNSSADEIRKIQDLRAELTTATRSYAIFLGFIVITVMPFLLSVSFHFLTAFLAIQPETEGAMPVEASNIPSFSGKVLITPNEMFTIAIMALVITSFFMSALVGILGRGKATYGLKYFPVFAICSIIFFFMAKTMIGTLLTGFGG